MNISSPFTPTVKAVPPEVITLLHELVPLVYDRYGLRLRSSDLEDLTRFLEDRWRAGSNQSWAAYRNLLLDTGPYSQQAWQPLINTITNTESYFFRDRGQFALLQRQIFPELIANHQNNRKLRIWSAACAGGEEPYSLAIALQSLLPPEQSWQVEILATDINQEALSRAKSGRFRSWSFRAIDPLTWQKYFIPIADGWQIVPEIQQLVTFQAFNLVSDQLPTIEQGSFDLVVCRNVFIYFSAESIALAVKTFSQALTTGGYLLTGHAELCHQPLQNFSTQIHPESVIYRRHPSEKTTSPRDSSPTLPPWATAHPIAISTAIAHHHDRRSTTPIESPSCTSDLDPSPNSQTKHQPNLPDLAQSPSPTSALPSVPIFSTARPTNTRPLFPTISPASGSSVTTNSWEKSLKNQEDYRQNRLKQKLTQLLQKYPKSVAVLYGLACLYANTGASQEAIDYCQKALEIEPESTEICCLLAQVWEEQNQLDRAKQFLRRAVYLDRHALRPRLELASLYERTGDLTAANRLYLSSLDLLRSLPPYWHVFDHAHLTAAELIDRLQQHLANVVS